MLEWRVPVAMLPAQRGGELGPRRERASARSGGPCRASATPLPVDDHHAPAGVVLRSGRATRASAGRRRLRPALERVLGERRHRQRVALDPSVQVAPARCVRTGSRAGSRAGEHDDRRARRTGEEAPAHVGTCRRSPTPRTVSIHDGSPSFLRSAATWTSIVFALPYQVVCQTSSRIARARDDGARDRAASSASRSNSFGVSSSSRPSSRDAPAARRRARAARARAPRRLAARSAVRRVTARIRATQLAEAERLDDVVVGAELEPDDPVDLLALGGDHDDRDARAGAELPADREAVDVRAGRRRAARDRARRASSAACPVATRSTSKPSRRSPSASGSAIASSSSTSSSFMARVSRELAAGASGETRTVGRQNPRTAQSANRSTCRCLRGTLAARRFGSIGRSSQEGRRCTRPARRDRGRVIQMGRRKEVASPGARVVADHVARSSGPRCGGEPRRARRRRPGRPSRRRGTGR